MKKQIPLFLLFLFSIYGSAQTSFYSQSLIKFDLAAQTTDKPIPFDRFFTLEISKLSPKNVKKVFAYEADFVDGERILVENQVAPGVKEPVKDIELSISPYGESLQIFFPPLKPNKMFEVIIVTGLSDDCKKLLMDHNAALSAGNDVKANFDAFLNCTIDKLHLTSNTDMDQPGYKNFFDTCLSTHYQKLSNEANFNVANVLTAKEISAIDTGLSAKPQDSTQVHYLMEVAQSSLFKAVALGIIDIKKVFLKDPKTIASMHQGGARLKNLKSNIAFFEELRKKVTRLLSKNIESVAVANPPVSLQAVYQKITKIQDDLESNKKILQDEMDTVEKLTEAKEELRQGVYLAANTVISDLKTAGGNILFVDAGFANILAPGLDDQATYIPKLYLGVSVYFRPIDKNTRRSSFSSRHSPLKDEIHGPDYGIVAKYSIWQHLSLNIGITLGSMTNKDFDNFYNSNSLLIGPAYRFHRAFKVSGGVALLRRSSKNPLISDKEIIPAGYLSLSVDVDFIQAIKDVTSIVFK